MVLPRPPPYPPHIDMYMSLIFVFSDMREKISGDIPFLMSNTPPLPIPWSKVVKIIEIAILRR